MKEMMALGCDDYRINPGTEHFRGPIKVKGK